MKNVYYDASLFKYDKETKTFVGNAWEIWDMDNKYNYPFPTGKRQFYIKNTKTGGFRRFKLIHRMEHPLDADMEVINFFMILPKNIYIKDYSPLKGYYLFESEDGIYCIVNYKYESHKQST